VRQPDLSQPDHLLNQPIQTPTSQVTADLPHLLQPFARGRNAAMKVFVFDLLARDRHLDHLKLGAELKRVPVAATTGTG
jgi:hypothetical protein